MRNIQIVQWLALLAATILLGGCGTLGGAEQRASRTLTYDDFARDSVEYSEQSAEAASADTISGRQDSVEDTPARDEEPLDVSPTSQPSHVQGSEPEPDVAPLSDRPTVAADNVPDEEWRVQPANLAPGQRVMINSLIGEINGRPVYANDFFAPIDSLIRREREKARSIATFEQTLKAIVEQRMMELVQSELLLAEAMSQITPEQQVGLIAWITSTREQIVRQRTGSVEVAEQELRAEGFTGLEDAVADERDKALLRMLLQKEVAPRVIVSWKDVQREYEKRFAEFNPPATAVLASIRLVPGKDDNKTEMVQQQLASGVSFTEVAKAAGMLRDGIMSEEPYVLGPGGFADVEGLNPQYRKKLSKMKEGDTVGPFTFVRQNGRGEWNIWLHVVDITQPSGRSIYDPDLQMQLKEELLQRQFFVEQNRYFHRLLDDVLEEEIDKLMTELVDIGKGRYS